MGERVGQALTSPARKSAQGRRVRRRKKRFRRGGPVASFARRSSSHPARTPAATVAVRVDDHLERRAVPRSLSALPRSIAFAGRARRAEMWQFVGLAGFALLAATGWDEQFGGPGTIGPWTLSVALLLVLPLASLAVRRMHDIGEPGRWAAMAFVPVIGTGALVALFLTPGERGANRFGVDPKGWGRGADRRAP
jgi:uncharacterized membrane protein YhaH (DUF805 family)